MPDAVTYTPSNGCMIICVGNTGDFVKKVDYDTLTRELAEARARIAELTKQRDTFMRGLEADAEECNELHAEIDALKAEVERLSAPVTDEEWSENYSIMSMVHGPRYAVNALILARRAQGGKP